MAQFQCSRGHKWEEAHSGESTQTLAFYLGTENAVVYCFRCYMDFFAGKLGTVQEVEAAPHDAPVFVSP